MAPVTLGPPNYIEILRPVLASHQGEESQVLHSNNVAKMQDHELKPLGFSKNIATFFSCLKEIHRRRKDVHVSESVEKLMRALGTSAACSHATLQWAAPPLLQASLSLERGHSPASEHFGEQPGSPPEPPSSKKPKTSCESRLCQRDGVKGSARQRRVLECSIPEEWHTPEQSARVTLSPLLPGTQNNRGVCSTCY